MQVSGVRFQMTENRDFLNSEVGTRMIRFGIADCLLFTAQHVTRNSQPV
jgi:hypothetical protein